MDLMEIRRGLMTQMANGEWKKTTITNPEYFRLGDALANFIENALPTANFAIGVLNCDLSDVSQLETGTVYAFTYDKTYGNRGRYLRILNGNLDASASREMTSVYLGIAQAGAKFTVLYQ